MIYSKIKELKGLVDEYQWQEGSLLVIVLGFKYNLYMNYDTTGVRPRTLFKSS